MEEKTLETEVFDLIEKRQKKNACGRPTTYNKETISKICEYILAGEVLHDICQREDMPHASTVFLWLAKHSEFSDLYVKAKAEQGEKYNDETIRIADTEADPARARIRVQARQWAAARLKPKRFGDSIKQEVSGSVGFNIIKKNIKKSDCE